MIKQIVKIVRFLCTLLPTLFWGLLIYGFDSPYIANITLISAIIHEIGHEIMLVIIEKKAIMPRGTSKGFIIRHEANLSYSNDIKVAVAGPALNIIIAALFFIFSKKNEYGIGFAVINILTALSNLLPSYGSDGYRILNALFLKSTSNVYCKALDIIAIFTNITILILALYLMMRIGEGYWIYGLFLFNSLTMLENLRKSYIF